MASSPTEAQLTVPPRTVYAEKGKSMGVRMIEFIRKLLGKNPKPIDETLIRDEL